MTDTVVMTKEDMLRRRVAWFRDMKPSTQGFVDTRLPEHERDTFNVIGAGVTEDADLKPGIAEVEDFNVTYIGAEPGKGAALHGHPTVEVFVPMTGRWTIYWNEGDAQEEVELGPMDCISVPPGVMRGFRNASDAYALLFVVLGGTNSGKVSWAREVLDRSAAAGLRLDAEGNIIQADAAE